MIPSTESTAKRNQVGIVHGDADLVDDRRHHVGRGTSAQSPPVSITVKARRTIRFSIQAVSCRARLILDDARRPPTRRFNKKGRLADVGAPTIATTGLRATGHLPRDRRGRSGSYGGHHFRNGPGDDYSGRSFAAHLSRLMPSGKTAPCSRARRVDEKQLARARVRGSPQDVVCGEQPETVTHGPKKVLSTVTARARRFGTAQFRPRS